jgi:two-component system sensor histidine kinase/response regulator
VTRQQRAYLDGAAQAAPNAQTAYAPRDGVNVMRTPTATVLIIEDEERLLQGLASVFRRAGFDVLTASDGSSGLRLARNEVPQAIVCDVMMPPPDGFELRKLLAESNDTATIPFLFLTARTSVEDRLRGINGGADDYITKPFDRQELVARVRAILRRHEVGKEIGSTEAERRFDRIRLHMMSGVSRELQRPIAGLVSTLAALRRRHGEVPERVTEYVEASLDCVHRIESMTQDLLALLELEHDPLPLPRERLDIVADLLLPVKHRVGVWKDTEFRDIDLSYSLDAALTVHAHPRLFPQAVVHLVDNACKFSPDGATVFVEVKANGLGGCTVTVTDNGPGMPAAIQDKVFERFFQGSQRPVQQYGGLGIGLTIAHLTARAHGGHLRFLSAPKGCRAQLEIPPNNGLNPRAIAPRAETVRCHDAHS